MLRSETQRFQCSNYMLQILKLDEFAWRTSKSKQRNNYRHR
jgi:hypothetical protein